MYLFAWHNIIHPPNNPISDEPTFVIAEVTNTMYADFASFPRKCQSFPYLALKLFPYSNEIWNGAV